MDYPINTAAQLRAVLRGLRKARGLSQADTGTRIGVNQKRIARIEAAPEVTSFDQIARIVSALGGRLVIQDLTEQSGAKPSGKAMPKGDW
ncbi:MAG: helix-turn-helix domain-containing protein [Opitutaceae bacterium]|nr:helix-turn-helix domain-containing protein [Opitutaceae bacterium]